MLVLARVRWAQLLGLGLILEEWLPVLWWCIVSHNSFRLAKSARSLCPARRPSSPRLVSPHLQAATMTALDGPRRHLLVRSAGAAALLPAAATAVFFVFYAVSLARHGSPIAALAIVAAVLDVLMSFVLALSLRPQCASWLWVAAGAVLSIAAAVVSAATLAWMSQWHGQLPSIVGKHPNALVGAGFGVFIAAVLLEAVFWTVAMWSVVSSNASSVREMEESRSYSDSDSDSKTDITTPYSVGTFSPASASEVTITTPARASKRFSLSQKLRSSSPKRKSYKSHKSHKSTSSQLTMSVSPPPTAHSVSPPRSEPEVNHFDTWDTTDADAQERVAETLAEVERENLQAALGLGITTSPLLRAGSPSPSPKTVERHNSPPLPENTISTTATRSVSYPTNIPLMATALGTPTFVRASVKLLAAHSGEFAEARWNVEQAGWDVDEMWDQDVRTQSQLVSAMA